MTWIAGRPARPEAAHRWRAPRPRLAWAFAIASVALIVALIESGYEAYSGRPVALQWLGPPTESLPDEMSRSGAFYVRRPEQARVGQPILSAAAEDSALSLGDLAWDASGQQLWRTGRTQRTRLVGRVGQHIRVNDLGTWDTTTRLLSGVDAVYDGSRWAIDPSALRPANSNRTLHAPATGGDSSGFWLSPGDAGYQLSPGEDADGPFVHIQATRSEPYLVLNTQDLLTTLDDAPVVVRAQVRSAGSGEARLTLYDVVSNDGRAETYTARLPSARQPDWTTLELHVDHVRFPSGSDNVSVGLFGVQPGEWFEVRMLEIFVGVLP